MIQHPLFDLAKPAFDRQKANLQRKVEVVAEAIRLADVALPGLGHLLRELGAPQVEMDEDGAFDKPVANKIAWHTTTSCGKPFSIVVGADCRLCLEANGFPYAITTTSSPYPREVNETRLAKALLWLEERLSAASPAPPAGS